MVLQIILTLGSFYHFLKEQNDKMICQNSTIILELVNLSLFSVSLTVELCPVCFTLFKS